MVAIVNEGMFGVIGDATVVAIQMGASKTSGGILFLTTPITFDERVGDQVDRLETVGNRG